MAEKPSPRGLLCGFVCAIGCVRVCVLALKRAAGRSIPRRSGDRRGANLPTYLRSIEVWS